MRVRAVTDANRYHCAEPWAYPSPVHRNHDSASHEHGELYVIGSLVVILLDGVLSLYVIDCLTDAWKNRRRAA